MAYKKINKWKELIVTEDILFANCLLLILNFLIKKIKINWWRWLLSGSTAELFDLFFLIIEKRFSNAGYQSIETIYIGEILLRLRFENLIISIPRKADKKYIPLSPIKFLFNILKNIKINNIGII